MNQSQIFYATNSDSPARRFCLIKGIIKFHEQKYPAHNLLITIPQAIPYFTDTDESEDPISLKGQT